MAAVANNPLVQIGAGFIPGGAAALGAVRMAAGMASNVANVAEAAGELCKRRQERRQMVILQVL
eukprot:COSAG06_NODE_4151_length_4523_cov_5.299729_7_plen_64_part_00